MIHHKTVAIDLARREGEIMKKNFTLGMKKEMIRTVIYGQDQQ